MTAPTTAPIPHRVVYDAECSDLLASIEASLHVCQDTLREGAILRTIVDRAHDLLHRLSERLVDNELAHGRVMAEGGWQDIAEAEPFKLTGKPIVALYADGHYAMRWWHAPAGCVPHWANENRPAFGEDPIAFWPIPAAKGALRPPQAQAEEEVA